MEHFFELDIFIRDGPTLIELANSRILQTFNPIRRAYGKGRTPPASWNTLRVWEFGREKGELRGSEPSNSGGDSHTLTWLECRPTRTIRGVWRKGVGGVRGADERGNYTPCFLCCFFLLCGLRMVSYHWLGVTQCEWEMLANRIA